jgi:lanthionine synthetase-like protein
MTALSKPIARSTTTLISHQHLWPRNRKLPGLAHGWQGSAWVAFKLAGAGVPVPDRVFDSIGRHLAVELGRAPPTPYVGASIGCAAEAVIAAYAARQGIASRASARAACKRVISACRNNPPWDVQLGLGGALLAFAEIEAIEPRALADFQPRRMVGQLLARVDTLCTSPTLGWPTGMAHGLAGVIMAAESCGRLGWCRITTKRRQRWLDALGRCALAATDEALVWPMIAGQQDLGLQSWCAGTPGVALALLECFHLTRQPAYLAAARGALEGMKLLASRVFFAKTLCCGNAGYRHIFLEAYRITAEPAWVEHASQAARFSNAAKPRPRLGLHQGELGISYLLARIANPLIYPFPGLGVSSASSSSGSQ